MRENSVSQTFVFEHTKSFQNSLEQYTTCAWDDQSQALLAEFSVDHADPIMAILLQTFPHSWDSKTIKKADPILKHKAQNFAQLKKSQLLMTKDIDGSEDLMAVWWPWGHGATVSIRVFLGNQETYIAETGILNKLVALLTQPFK